jgi:hypothetical protein
VTSVIYRNNSVILIRIFCLVLSVG